MSDLSKINVVILAGGLGTRLQSKILGKQKVLADVKKRPFLEYILEQLYRARFKKIVLCTGFLGEQVEKTFGKEYKKVKLLYSNEHVSLGTAGALRNALPLLKSDLILVMNGDSFCQIDFESFLQFHLNKKSEVSLVLSKVLNSDRFGRVELGKNYDIIQFKEKKDSKEGYINAGIYLLNKNLIKDIPLDKNISLEKEVFPNWIGKGFYGYKGSKKFIDIGTPESYSKAEKFFKNKK
jgi:D-glycero-alpha-D-manno-heptose 1-phosphate guanylyltransferase